MSDAGKDEKFALRLAALRKSSGISIESLSRVSGVSCNAIERYEAGYAEPTTDFLERAACVFGVSLSYIALFSDEAVLNEPDGIHEVFVMSSLGENGIMKKSDIAGITVISRDGLRCGDYFAFVMNDDSMEALRIRHGDLLIIRRTKNIASGDTVIAILDGKTVVRRYKRLCCSHYLISGDRSRPPLEIKSEELRKIIYGKVEEIRISLTGEKSE